MEKPNIPKNILTKLGFSDPGKLVVTVSMGKKAKIPIHEDLMDTYVYLLNREEVISFGYNFYFESLPYSSILREDLHTLIKLGYISKNSPILSLTNVGQDWVEKKLESYPELGKLEEKVTTFLCKIASWSKEQLFYSVYYLMVK